MSEDPRTRASIERLIERLEHLERLLQANTIRLHAVERRLGLEPAALPLPQRRPLYESLKDERDEHARRAGARDERERADTETHANAPAQPDATPAAGTSDTHAWMANDAGLARPSVTEEKPGEATTNGDPSRAGAWTGATRASVGTDRPGGTNAPRAGASVPRDAANATTATAKKRDIESLIGGSWFNWIGIIAVTLGVAFFLKFAFDNQWIGPGARVSLGALAGVALLYAGERLRGRGLRQYAFVISGGGILILYLSIYAAHSFYQLLSQPVAFLLMALVTTTAVALSVRQNALAIAILGLVGGFATPVLLSTGVDNQIALFTYIALLDAGVLAIAYFKRWRSLDFLSFLGTLLMIVGWADSFYAREKLWTTLVFLSIFFILYALLAVFHNTLRRQSSRWFDVSLLAANATLYFAFSYFLLAGAGYDHATPASHALLVSVFFICLFYTVWRWNRADRLLTYAYVGAAVVFLTTALAIQLELQWVTIAWAVEALALVLIGLRTREASARHAALAVFCAAVIHWFTWDMRRFALGADASFVPLLNRRALGCAVLVAALYAAARLYKRAEGVGEEERRAASTFFSLSGNALGLTLLSLDVNDFFNSRLDAVPLSESDARSRVENARQFSMTALWAFYGATAFALGARLRSRALRYGGLLLLVLTILKLLFADLGFYDAAWHAPVFNETFAAFALVVAIFWYVARTYARSAGELEEGGVALSVVTVVANLLAIVALSAEAAGYFESRTAAAALDALRLRDLELAKQLSLSVVWALYGGGLLVVGRLRRVRLLRLMSLFLLSLTTLKVFFWDLSSLDRVYRIISFIVLGAILLAVSYLYQKSQQRQADEANETP